MAIQVKNVRYQPIELTLTTGRSLKIGGREIAEVTETESNSPAIKYHCKRGNIVILGAAIASVSAKPVMGGVTVAQDAKSAKPPRSKAK